MFTFQIYFVLISFFRLDTQCSSNMMKNASRLGRLILPGIGSVSGSVREKSLLLLQKYAAGLKTSPEFRKIVIKAISAVSLMNFLKLDADSFIYFR